MFGPDSAMRGQEAVFDVGEHGVRPAEGGVTRGGATGARDVALVDNARLVGYATKPLPAVADDSGSGLDTELSPNFGDGLRVQAAAVWAFKDAGLATTSIPSVNLTP